MFKKIRKNIRKQKCLTELRRCTRQALNIRKHSQESTISASTEESKSNSKHSPKISSASKSLTPCLENSRETLESSHLTCPICMDFVADAATTLCGHTFCEYCLFEWALFNKDCPVCRQGVRQEAPYPCPTIDVLVEVYLSQPSMKGEREAFATRKQQLANWKLSKA
eukprot:TRINITY_DN953_c0_g1_i8.p1 TRINITY_DN953_c0_g1~~TRINITY_DN953_c0_g1_i8.p1  ORF type:complete len:167 (+),score=19.49 TRINITY_DN953_c0_g1_i8:203-703(+)